jgi:hypothetical protein
LKKRAFASFISEMFRLVRSSLERALMCKEGEKKLKNPE